MQDRNVPNNSFTPLSPCMTTLWFSNNHVSQTPNMAKWLDVCVVSCWLDFFRCKQHCLTLCCFESTCTKRHCDCIHPRRKLTACATSYGPVCQTALGESETLQASSGMYVGLPPTAIAVFYLVGLVVICRTKYKNYHFFADLLRCLYSVAQMQFAGCNRATVPDP